MPDHSRSPLRFFALVYALSIPFWILGAAAPVELLPGLPVSALMLLVVPVAALMMAYREAGAAGAWFLLARVFKFPRVTSKIWYLPVLLLMPFIAVLSYLLLRAMETPLPNPRIHILHARALLLVLGIAGLAEEMGWSGYTTDPLQQHWGALQAAVIIGLVWGAWHITPLTQVGRSPGWIGWWYLGTVGSRVLIVWIYNNTGKSVAAAGLYHAILNLCWQLFPNNGSHYDPRLTPLLIVCAAAIVTMLWGPRTLQQHSLPGSGDSP